MADARSAERRGDPNAAALLTWFLPGAGHAYLGRFGTALAIFVVVEGLYALGWWLSHGRVFEFLDPELRGPFATILAPEAANLGAMLAQLKQVGFGSAELSPFPSAIAWGGMLTAVSGIANVACMAHAHLQARSRLESEPRGASPALLVFAAWAVPGLGHWLQGRRRRGLIVCVLLVGFFAWGTWMAEGSNLSRERHFYYWSGQFLVGLPALIGEAIHGRAPVNHDLAYVDAGLLFACMAGLLNVIAMLDVFGVAERRWLRRDEPSAATMDPGRGGPA